MRALALGTLLLLLLPITVLAQGNPNNPADFSRNPHPTMPWFGPPFPGRADYGGVPRRPPLAQDVRLYGAVVGYIEVPPQQVVVNVYVPGPGSLSGGFEPQLFEIPGYVVTETTTGYIYPARVGLREVTPGVFNWVTEPQGFQPR